MKLNPKKISFGMEEGKFLGYIVTSKGIRENPEKTKAVMNMPSPSSLKQIQRLSGKLVVLNRFMSKVAERVLPCLDTFKKCANKKGFQWTAAAKEAFQSMKKLIAELPRNAIKGQVLANFLADIMAEDRPAHTRAVGQEETSMEGKVQEIQRTIKDQIPTAPPNETNIWKLYTDRASNDHRSGAGLILIDSEGAEYPYTLRLNFTNSNNDAEYKALLAGLRIAAKMKVKKMHAGFKVGS
ncbi:reverse transcriptase domain-containing protein [Tanacetum coccineum]